MANGDFLLAEFTTVITLLSHLLDVSAANYRSAAKKNAKEFAYDGFNANEILNSFLKSFKANEDDEEALQDLCDIVNIGLTRGNIRADQLSKTSKKGRERIEELSKKYNIKIKKSKSEKMVLSNSTLTFTRSISVFPYVASQLLATRSCEVEPNNCPFGTDDLPVAFKHSGFSSLIPTGNNYCLVLFQCHIAYMISFGKKINPENKDDITVWYNKQKQFSFAAWNNVTLYNNEYRKKAFKNLGLDSHEKYGALYLKIVNNIRKAIKEEEVKPEDLAPYVKEGKIE
ncbi:nucleocapsid protein [Grapevine Muscat rose virus]|uniref:Nucleoprotein n=1 Tax=Grapevine Muscat rose virus TaxID=2601259 RepID=A0A5B8MA21_9VIRU|nr:nucleocapsid protein [Grapevine Muscat rose virus]QDZ17044.1 nucleocapsid protein [Grapevine Muscat rose virus]